MKFQSHIPVSTEELCKDRAVISLLASGLGLDLNAVGRRCMHSLLCLLLLKDSVLKAS